MNLQQLITRKEQSPPPKTVCLCGSTRFFQAFQEMNLQETLAGNIVLSIGCDTKAYGELPFGTIDKIALDILHLHKIDRADEVIILNVGGYIGESTRREIAYAQLMKKPLRWLEGPEYIRCVCCPAKATTEILAETGEIFYVCIKHDPDLHGPLEGYPVPAAMQFVPEGFFVGHISMFRQSEEGA